MSLSSGLFPNQKHLFGIAKELLYDQTSQPRGPLERHTFDREYVARLTTGDPEVERHFTDYFGKLLLIKLRARLRSPQSIGDIRQTTFARVLAILRGERGIDHPERLGAFVNTVCENVLLEHFRNERRYDQLLEGTMESPDGATSPESHIITEERKALLRKALVKISRADRELLQEVYFEQKDKDQICRERNITRENLRVRVSRAIKRLRLALAENS